ncbi:MAG: hypothetical protein ACPGVG_18580 [Mycobacterium sp.]
MSEAAVWWEPKGADIPDRISLGRLLTDLQKQPTGRTRASRTLSGRRDLTKLTGGRRIKVTSGPIEDYDTADRLEEMASYLRRGGLVSLAEDQTKAWASFATSAAGSLVTLQGAPWQAYSAGTPTVGERFRLHGPTPGMLIEGHEVDSTISIPGSLYGGIVPASSIRADWSGESHVLVREYGFWPVLRMPEDQMEVEVLKHKSRRFFTLEMTLETDEHAIAALATDPTVVFNGPTDLGNPTMVGHLKSIGGV